MLLKFGVDISRLEMHCRKALYKVEKLWAEWAFSEAVITSTYEGTHSVGSLHYHNRAFDLRLPTSKNEDQKELVLDLKEVLGKEFDVVLEGTHIHVEYDPK